MARSELCPNCGSASPWRCGCTEDEQARAAESGEGYEADDNDFEPFFGYDADDEADERDHVRRDEGR